MNAFLSLGRWVFPLPFLVFGIFHLMGAKDMAGMVPSYIPGGVVWVYVTGIAMIAAAISMYAGKFDKLAATLLSVLLLIYVLTIHLKGAMAGDQMATGGLLKDLGLAAASMIYAQYVAKDRSVVG